jgi:hypothetical protein
MDAEGLLQLGKAAQGGLAVSGTSETAIPRMNSKHPRQQASLLRIWRTFLRLVLLFLPGS